MSPVISFDTGYCRNCKQSRERHVDSKCLFDVTEYQAMDADEYTSHLAQELEVFTKEVKRLSGGFQISPSFTQKFAMRPTLEVTSGRLSSSRNLLAYVPTPLPIL